MFRTRIILIIVLLTACITGLKAQFLDAGVPQIPSEDRNEYGCVSGKLHRRPVTNINIYYICIIKQILFQNEI